MKSSPITRPLTTSPVDRDSDEPRELVAKRCVVGTAEVTSDSYNSSGNGD